MSPSDNDVVYLGTIARRDGSPASACPTTTAADRTDYHTRRAKPLRVSDSRSPRRPRRPRHPRHHDEPIIPFEIRKKYVALGWVRNWSDLTTRPVVFGFFDGAGRLCRRRGHKGPDSSIDGPSNVAIDHDEVEYKPRFQGMSKTQIRDELSRHLIKKAGRSLGPGEI
ncbi:hypothetical protein BGZ61DRAFT_483486 [Ilyonectria robusta]|uniref:uncharacterized protein n=1 Tax=Ilyonectria robusta TaxID=1079257 RepID=UPI001E8D8FFF|nr:uncharacterized protein BGZ61DRAFT_483486 [Ilyonectria robusta]KAH8669320.1 hypothetical protein BGZ61DRAFT_483486 [Ilyonectria robusta]